MDSAWAQLNVVAHKMLGNSKRMQLDARQWFAEIGGLPFSLYLCPFCVDAFDWACPCEHTSVIQSSRSRWLVTARVQSYRCVFLDLDAV